MQSTLGSFFKVKGNPSTTTGTAKNTRTITPAPSRKNAGKPSVPTGGLKSLTSFWQPQTKASKPNTPSLLNKRKENQNVQGEDAKNDHLHFPPSVNPEDSSQIDVIDVDTLSEHVLEKGDGVTLKKSVQLYSDGGSEVGLEGLEAEKEDEGDEDEGDEDDDS